MVLSAFRIQRADLAPYTLRLRLAVRTASGDRRECSGFLLKVTDAAGRQGVGDAILCEETAEARASLRRELVHVVDHLTCLSKDDRAKACAFDHTDEATSNTRRWRLPKELERFLTGKTSTVRFATELALLDLQARQLEQSPAQRLTGPERSPVRRLSVNALVADAQQARAAVDAGYNHLKVKVGTTSIDGDLRRLREIRNVVGSNAILRLDANGAYDLAQATSALRTFSSLSPLFVEQPLAPAKLDDLARLRTRVRLPLAADEGARTAQQLTALIQRELTDVVVLKPSLCGGLQSTLNLAESTIKAGLCLVITHAFESAIGRQGIIQLTAAIAAEASSLLLPCGLLAGHFFERDLADEPSAIGGEIDLTTPAPAIRCSAARGDAVLGLGRRPIRNQQNQSRRSHDI